MRPGGLLRVHSGTLSGVISDCGDSGSDCSNAGATGGGLIKIGTGTLTLSGSNTYTGATTVNAGALVVNGDISPSSGVTVNSGATLGGIGQLPTTVINSGGTFAPGPGTPMNVIGDLTLNSGSTFRVGSSGGVVVTGTANLGGLLQIIPQTRVNATTTFTFLSAGTVSGTFDSISFTNSALARNAMVSFVGGDILLTLDPGLLSPMLPASANLNQRRVANGIDNALIGGAQPVAGFNTLLGLAGAQLTNALTQASGPAAAAAHRSAHGHPTLVTTITTTTTSLMTNPVVQP